MAMDLYQSGQLAEAAVVFAQQGDAAWAATCYRELAERCHPLEGRARRQFYRLARRQARAAPLDAHGCRERGLLAAARGHTLRARSWLDASLARATSGSDRAASQAAWRQVGMVAGWVEVTRSPSPGADAGLDLVIEAACRIAGSVDEAEVLEHLLRAVPVVDEETDDSIRLPIPGPPRFAVARGPRAGRVAGLVALASTVLEHLQAVAAHHSLQQSQADLASLFDSINVGIVVVDERRRISMVNQAFADLCGQPPSVLEGQPDRILFHVDDLVEDEDAFQRVAAGQWQHHRAEVRLMRRDGEPCWVGMTVSRLRDRRVVRAMSRLSYHQVEMLVRLQEVDRRKLSLGLHDFISQSLIAVFYDLQRFERAPAQLSTLDDTVRLLHAILRDAVELATHLEVPLPNSQNLRPALDALLQAFAVSSGIDTKYRISPAVDVVDGLPAVVAYRIVQESLSNAYRHAAARRIDVTVDVTEGVLHVEVQDDGRGFNPAEVRHREVATRHFGLRGMQERAELVGAELNVHSQPGVGTSTRFRLALNAS